MSDQPRTELLAGFINNLKPESRGIPSGPREKSDFTAFSEVMRSERREIEALSERTVGRTTETEHIKKEESPRQSDEIAEEDALVREDVAASKILAQEKEALKEDAGDLKTDSAQDEKGRHQAGLGNSIVNVTTSSSAEGPPGLEKAAGNLMEQGEQVRGDAGDQTKSDLKTGLAKELLAKQSEIGLRQMSSEKPESMTEKPLSVTKKPESMIEKPLPVTEEPESVIEKPLPVTEKPESVIEKPLSVTEKPEAAIKKRTSSIDESLSSAGIPTKKVGGSQSGASQWMGSGRQDGTGQGGAFLGNSILTQVSNFESNEGLVAQNTATDFRSILDAGRAIPDERAVLRQVTQQLRAWRPGQHEPMRFLLDPKNLGMLQIEVMLKEGRLTAHIVTADPMVKALLEGSQHVLQNALKDQGLQLQQFSVDLGDQKSFMNDARNTHDFRQSPQFSEESDVIEVGQMTSSGLKAGNSGLSLYI